MKRLPLLLMLLLTTAATALDDGLPPVYGDDVDEPVEEEFSLATLFGEGLEFLGRLDLWGRYYATENDELGTSAEARFSLNSRSGPTRVEVVLGARAFGGYDARLAGGEELRLGLERAVVSYSKGRLGLSLGRQRLARGPAYLFNPSDLFATASLFDPTVEDAGLDALTGRLYLGALTGIELTAVPRRYAADGVYGLRLFTNLLGFDASAAYHHVGDYSPGVRSHFISCWLNGDLRLGDWDGPGLWVEYGLHLPYSDDLSVETVWRLDAGLEYTFGPNLTAIVEYYHNGAGAESFEDYDWSALVRGRETVLGRDYLCAVLDYDLTSLITAGALCLVNLHDHSGLAGPSVRFNLSDNVEASLGAFLFFGPASSEFGHEGVDLGAFLLPAYPHTVYLRVEAAF